MRKKSSSILTIKLAKSCLNQHVFLLMKKSTLTASKSKALRYYEYSLNGAKICKKSIKVQLVSNITLRVSVFKRAIL